MNHQNHNGFDPFVKFPLCSSMNSVGQDEIWYISGENVPRGQSQSHRRISWPSFSTLFIALFSFFLSILSDSTNWHASIHMQLKPSRAPLQGSRSQNWVIFLIRLTLRFQRRKNEDCEVPSNRTMDSCPCMPPPTTHTHAWPWQTHTSSHTLRLPFAFWVWISWPFHFQTIIDSQMVSILPSEVLRFVFNDICRHGDNAQKES